MRCAYCNGPCDDRPVWHEACCWSCHLKHQAERRSPGFLKRLAASLVRNKPILDGLRRHDSSNETSSS